MRSSASAGSTPRTYPFRRGLLHRPGRAPGHERHARQSRVRRDPRPCVRRAARRCARARLRFGPEPVASSGDGHRALGDRPVGYRDEARGEAHRGHVACRCIRPASTARGSSLPDDRFDGALSTMTLCTIPDVSSALAELRRVLKPGAEFHFAEHGRVAGCEGRAHAGSVRRLPAARRRRLSPEPRSTTAAREQRASRSRRSTTSS